MGPAKPRPGADLVALRIPVATCCHLRTSLLAISMICNLPPLLLYSNLCASLAGSLHYAVFRLLANSAGYHRAFFADQVRSQPGAYLTSRDLIQSALKPTQCVAVAIWRCAIPAKPGDAGRLGGARARYLARCPGPELPDHRGPGAPRQVIDVRLQMTGSPADPPCGCCRAAAPAGRARHATRTALSPVGRTRPASGRPRPAIKTNAPCQQGQTGPTSMWGARPQPSC